MNCKTCKHWKPTMYGMGKCSEIREKIDIEVTYGWDGGTVDYVETDEDFGCTQYNGISYGNCREADK